MQPMELPMVLSVSKIDTTNIVEVKTQLPGNSGIRYLIIGTSPESLDHPLRSTLALWNASRLTAFLQLKKTTPCTSWQITPYRQGAS